MRKIVITLLVFVLSVSGALAYDFDSWEEESESTGMSGKVLLEGEFLDGDILKISTLVEEIAEPVLGASFHLKFDDDALEFLRYEPGDFLERGGDPFYLVKQTGGKVYFGATLRRDDSFPLGNGAMTQFYFQILEGEEFSFEFENGVISTLDTVRQDLQNLEWAGLKISRNDEGDKAPTTAKTAQANVSDSASRVNAKLLLVILGAVLSALAVILIIRKSNVRLVKF